MRRNSTLFDQEFLNKVNANYYSRPCDRGSIFEVSNQEIAASSIALQRKLEQNARFFNSSEVKSSKRVMINVD